MKNSLCVIHELAETMQREPSLKAVWLDADKKRISFACHPVCDEERTRQLLNEVIASFEPHDIPDCTTEPWHVDCAHCTKGDKQPMPEGVRLVALPGSGILLDKGDTSTTQRLWKWQHYPWIKVRPIDVSPQMTKEWRVPLALALTCGATTLAGFILQRLAGGELTVVALACYVVAYATGSYETAIDVWTLLKKRVLDIHFLMLAVAVGAALIGHWWEGAVLMFLFSFSGALEDYAMRRTEREINSLFKAAPKQATVLSDDGKESSVSVESLLPGMRIRVRPGESIPVDARVIDGTSATDEANLTGESVPVDKQTGDHVLAGTMNLWGRLDAEVIRPATESSLSKIIRLIRNARESKAPSQRFTDHFGTIYTYSVLGLSAVMFLVWRYAMNLSFDQAFYQTMTLLVVSSPCALVLSIPSAVLAGIAAGARRGILFRGGLAIEKLAEIDRVALDKTGTLTTGHLVVVLVESFPTGREDDVLRMAAALDTNSTHPAATAITRAATERKFSIPAAREFRSITGQGVSGLVDEAGIAAQVHLGRRTLMANASWTAQIPLPDIGQTEVFLESGPLRGRILLRDEIRSASKPLLDRLARYGIHLTMLSGDRPEAARHVAESVGLLDVRAGLDPEHKVMLIQEWAKKGQRVAMVGDGVNDAPSLAAAHIGIAMGLRGSDAALEQADVVLMQDRLDRFYTAYLLSRKARRIIRQNLAVSLGSVVVLVTAALAATIPLTVGVIGHEGSTVVVVLNSLRLLFGRMREDTAVPAGTAGG
ncbi:MAG: cation-translocating P-type ATPase [bacterium]